MSAAAPIVYSVSPPVSDEALNALFAAAWRDHRPVAFEPVLRRSLAYVCAHAAGELIGYVNLAWDGRAHAFLLDTTVHPQHQRRGIGRALVARAIEQAQARGVSWVHVDHEPHLRGFYAACGFRASEAGLHRIGE